MENTPRIDLLRLLRSSPPWCVRLVIVNHCTNVGFCVDRFHLHLGSVWKPIRVRLRLAHVRFRAKCERTDQENDSSAREVVYGTSGNKMFTLSEDKLDEKGKVNSMDLKERKGLLNNLITSVDENMNKCRRKNRLITTRTGSRQTDNSTVHHYIYIYRFLSLSLSHCMQTLISQRLPNAQRDICTET